MNRAFNCSVTCLQKQQRIKWTMSWNFRQLQPSKTQFRIQTLRWGGGFSKKFFRPFGPHFSPKIKGGGAPPGPPPGSATEISKWIPALSVYEGEVSALQTMTKRMKKYQGQGSPNIRESGFRNVRNFCLWKLDFWALESRIQLKESRILCFGIRNTAQGIRNPTNDWNPESKFH